MPLIFPSYSLAPHLPSTNTLLSTRTHLSVCVRVFSARTDFVAAPVVGTPNLMQENEEDKLVGEDRCEEVSLTEWQGWGTSSPMPALVAKLLKDMRKLEKESGSGMSFGGLGGKLQGDFKVIEDKKHRAVYQSISDPEEKLQYNSARQVACRLLGSRGYLCQKCWLTMEDCMCSNLVSCSLWKNIRLWLYMHPKDFLRKNNTGKLLWQVFGTESASLCISGIHEQEEIMWDAFKRAGKDMVWVLYPNKNSPTRSVQDIFSHQSVANSIRIESKLEDMNLNFVLIDGTWSNSHALFNRLTSRASKLWGEEHIPCISLNTLGASAMHKLRPQPSWDRTCTAAAAAGLLRELHFCPKFGEHRLDEQANAVETALGALLEALTGRRRRMGRPTTRFGRDYLC